MRKTFQPVSSTQNNVMMLNACRSHYSAAKYYVRPMIVERKNFSSRNSPYQAIRRLTMKTPRMIFCLTLLSISLAVQVSAQVNNASLTGLVTDSAGAVVPNASVMVKNKATDVESTTTTDSSGYYTFASLPVGSYTVTVGLPGFKKSI